MKPSKTTQAWLFGLFCLFLALAVLIYQLLTPSDGARISKSLDAWTRQGIRLHVYPEERTSLQDGDLLVAIDGVDLGEVVARLFQPGSAWRQHELRLPAVYRVVRDGQIQDLPVPPVPQPFGEIAREQWNPAAGRSAWSYLLW